jgi:hypothetical protein
MYSAAQARILADHCSLLWLPPVLEGIWLSRYGQLRRAIRASPAFAFAASRLCHAPYGVLHRDELDAALGKAGLGGCVEDLLREYLLAVRPRSAWALDVPPEAFPVECNELATAYSAVDMYCLKRLEKRGFLPEASKVMHCSAFQDQRTSSSALNHMSCCLKQVPAE